MWAAQRWLAHDAPLAARIGAVRRAIEREFGLKARLAGPLVGRFVLSAMRREARHLGRGRTYEPPTFYETNVPRAGGRNGLRPCRWVEPVPRAEAESAIPAPASMRAALNNRTSAPDGRVERNGRRPGRLADGLPLR